MTKNITTEEAVIVSQLLQGVKLTSVKGKDKFPVIRAISALRPIMEAYAATEKDAQERLRPENWETLVEQSGKWDTLTDEEKTIHNATAEKYQREVTECLSAERKKAVSVEVGVLSEDALASLFDSNPEWNGVQAELIMDFFTAASQEGEAE